MSAALIIKEMLNDAAVFSLVGDRVAFKELPQNTAYPAIVYNIITTTPIKKINPGESVRTVNSRIQINPLAETFGEVEVIHAAIRSAIDLKKNVTFANKRVVSCMWELEGQADRDGDSGIWTQPADYILIFQE